MFAPINIYISWQTKKINIQNYTYGIYVYIYIIFVKQSRVIYKTVSTDISLLDKTVKFNQHKIHS